MVKSESNRPPSQVAAVGGKVLRSKHMIAMWCISSQIQHFLGQEGADLRCFWQNCVLGVDE